MVIVSAKRSKLSFGADADATTAKTIGAKMSFIYEVRKLWETKQ